MFVCLFIYINLFICIYIHLYSLIFINIFYIYLYIFIYIYLYIFIFIYIYIYIFIYLYVLYLYIIFIYLYIYVCMCDCVCVHTCSHHVHYMAHYIAEPCWALHCPWSWRAAGRHDQQQRSVKQIVNGCVSKWVIPWDASEWFKIAFPVGKIIIQYINHQIWRFSHDRPAKW